MADVPSTITLEGERKFITAYQISCECSRTDTADTHPCYFCQFWGISDREHVACHPERWNVATVTDLNLPPLPTALIVAMF